MADFEDRLRHELKFASQQPDETFVADVDRKVGAYERRRVVWLVLASVAAGLLVACTVFGLSMLTPMWSALADALRFGPPIFPADILRYGAPAAVLVLLALLLAPAVHARR